jgi:hypothetical protein
MSVIRWAYGVTTVPERANDLLPRTLRSLAQAGFNEPRIFVDGSQTLLTSIDVGLEQTLRWPRIKTFGSWSLGLWELLIRNPGADRYAMFQDDFVTCLNLRQYLERVPYPEKGYQNLYTFPSNQSLVPMDQIGWYESRELDSGNVFHGKKQQTGRGAVALVFSKDAVIALMSELHYITKPIEAAEPWRRVDGCIVNAMNKAGWREYVHNPSLVQHTGRDSSMGSRPHLQATSFRGEDFDLLRLL